jgi:hypothetical protein
VAVDFIDRARAGDVHDEDSEAGAGPPRRLAYIVELFVERSAIEETSEVVGAGLALEPAHHGVAAPE